MKTSLDHLPERKRRHVAAIVEEILRVADVDMVILFGSHARGDWVEDPVGGYFSDYDVLVIVKNEKMVDKHDLWSTIEQRASHRIEGRVLSMIVHDVEDVSRRLELGQYFFSDIKKEGIVLHDAGRIALPSAKEKTPEERRRYARQNYEQWFETADQFFAGYEFMLSKGWTKLAAFQLHQATERYYTAALLVLTEYKSQTHNLSHLGKLAASHAPSLRDGFPLSSPENKRLFELLKKAYVEARYSAKYAIAAEELQTIAERVKELRARVEAVCAPRIEEPTAS